MNDRTFTLVNNAGNFYAGFFEELSPEQVRNQIETLLFGPMNVAMKTFETRANALLAQAAAHRDLSSSLAHDET